MEPHRRCRRRRPRHRRHQRQPHDADGPRDPRVGRRAARRSSACRAQMLPEIRPSSDARLYGDDPGPRAARRRGADHRRARRPAGRHGRPGLLRAGEAKNTYGTGNFLLLNTGEELVARRTACSRRSCYQFGDAKPVYALEGSIAVTGSAVQWLRDQLGIISGAVGERDARGAGRRQRRRATSCRPSPVSSPRTGVRDARGAIVGLSRFNTNAHIARATLEAICYQSRDVADAMEKDSGVKLEVLKVDGGVTANDLCMQIQADVLGVPVSRPVVAETTALGAAYAAGLAIGFWETPTSCGRTGTRASGGSPRGPGSSARTATAGGARPSSGPSTGWRCEHGGAGDPAESRRPRRGAAADGGRRARRPRHRWRRHRCGAALDAVTRGLRVGLVEARDYAAGTSSRSSQAGPRRPALPRAARTSPWCARPFASAR